MHTIKAMAIAAGLAGVIFGYPWVLAWVLIPYPSPSEVRALAERPLAIPTWPVAAADALGTVHAVPVARIAGFTPGSCLRMSETDGIARSVFVVRVTHLCRIELTVRDTSTTTAVIVRNHWVGDAPEGLHENPFLAEEHELPDMLARIGP